MDFSAYPHLIKYLPNWMERFYPRLAQFAKGDGYPCGNQGVFIPRDKKCWTHPKTGQKLKKPLTYQMYQEAKAKKTKINKSSTKPLSSDDWMAKMVRDLTGEGENVAIKEVGEDILSVEAKTKREKLLKLLDDFESKGHISGDGEYFIFSNPDQALEPDRAFKKMIPKERLDIARTVIRATKESNKLGYGSKLNNDEIIAKQERILESQKRLKRDFDNFLRKSRKLVQVDNPTKINTEIVAGSDADRRLVQRGVSAFSKLIEIPDLKASVGIVNDQIYAPLDRSYFDPNENAVFMGRYNKKVQPRVGSVVHELGHWLDHNHPEIRDEVSDFFNKRTKGEPTQLISDLVERGGYTGEITKKDKFLHPYIGKVYKGSPKTTEVLSMGLQLMHDNPAYLAKKDPEMFDFIYKVVRRGVRRK